MNLSYNGKALEITLNTHAAIEIQQTGHVLGKSYKMLQGRIATRHNFAQLRYRGMDYAA